VLFAASCSTRPPFALYVPSAHTRGIDLLELTLLGPGWHCYSWAILALQDALRDGLGRDRKSFEIEEILQVTSNQSRHLCGNDLSQLTPSLEPERLKLTVEPFGAEQPVEIGLLSPLRIIQDGHLLRGSRDSGPAGIPFDLLIARALDRYQGLYPADISQLPEILKPDVRKTVESEAAQVQLLSDHTCWVEVRDYSVRHQRQMRLGGWVGRLVYGEGAAHFLSILRAAEIFHIGKNPTSGCGRIQVTLPTPAA
jgi:hypothetical protein